MYYYGIVFFTLVSLAVDTFTVNVAFDPSTNFEFRGFWSTWGATIGPWCALLVNLTSSSPRYLLVTDCLKDTSRSKRYSKVSTLKSLLKKIKPLLHHKNSNNNNNIQWLTIIMFIIFSYFIDVRIIICIQRILCLLYSLWTIRALRYLNGMT